MTRILREKLAENDEKAALELMDAVLKDAMKKDGQSRRLVLEYIEGRPSVTIEADVTNHVVPIIDDV